MGRRVVVEDRARVQQAVRVHEPLELAHHRVGRRTPLLLHEGSHVAPGAVLALQRAVVGVDDQLGERVHEAGVAGDLGRLVQGLGQQEVQVAVLGMTEDHTVGVAVRGEQGGQVDHRVGQALDRERDVLQQHRRPGLTGRADRGEQAAAHRPVLRLQLRIAGELPGHDQLEACHQLSSGLLEPGQLRHVGGAEVDEQPGCALGQPGQVGRDTGPALDRPHRGPVHQLDRGGTGVAQRHHGRAGGVHVREDQEPGDPVRKHDNRVEHGLGDEGQRPLGTDQQMPEDLQRLLEVQEGVEAVAGGVLARVLRPDPPAELGVGKDPGAQLEQAGSQRRLLRRERFGGSGSGRVDHRPGRQQEGQRGQRVVGVLRHAAAHPARVVRDDPADRAGGDARRVRAELAAVRLQGHVDPGRDRPGLDPHAQTVVLHLHPAPVPGHLNQDPVALRLARQARARRPERQRDLASAAVREQLAHLARRLRQHHRPGHHAVEAGVGGVHHQLDGTAQHTLGRHDRAQLAPQPVRCPVGVLVGGRVAAPRPAPLAPPGADPGAGQRLRPDGPEPARTTTIMPRGLLFT